jgi:hypothetical protein
MERVVEVMGMVVGVMVPSNTWRRYTVNLDYPAQRWSLFLASEVPNALAVAVGASAVVRADQLRDRLTAVAHPEKAPMIEACLGEIQRTRAGFRLNPRADLGVEGLLDRLAMMRQGRGVPARAPGALS